MKRNWKKYNKSLVRRGEIMLSFDAMEQWGTELKEMNHNKEGHTGTFILNHSWKHQVLPSLSTSAIQTNRRPDKITSKRKIKNSNVFCHLEKSQQVTIKMNPKLGKDIVIATDSTGVKVQTESMDETKMAETTRILENSCGSRCKIKTDNRFGNYR